MADKLTETVERLKNCDWPEGARFSFFDSPGPHDPCFVVMPDGAALPVNHHGSEGVDVARAKFIIDACNAALSRPNVDEEVTQADREAAADLIETYWMGSGIDHDIMRRCAQSYRDGHTQGVWAEAFRAHRVAALRGSADNGA